MGLIGISQVAGATPFDNTGTGFTSTNVQDAITEAATLASVIDGAAFITNIVPTSTGNVASKTYSSDGVVLETALTDTQLVTVSVLGLTGHTNYKPVLTLSWGIHTQIMTITASADKPVFTGSAAIDLQGETILIITHEDGGTHTTTLTVDAPPVIVSANFTGGYPGSQTELKSGDHFSFNVVSDIPIIAIEFTDAGAYTAQSFSVASSTNHTVSGLIANRGTSVQSLGATVRVQKSTGSWSTYHLTSGDGSVDGTNLIKLNNLFPSVSTGTITYPASQGALKGTETATVVNTISNYDTIAYTSGNGDLTITNPTIMETPKTVTRLGGSYNVVTNNFHISANRVANNATTTADTLVKIANTNCTLTVTEPATRLRSGGNDGTAAQNHVITITANQDLFVAPTLAAGGQGVFQGAGFAGSGTTWTRSLQVTDNMTKGTYAWGSIVGTNLAGLQTTAITGNTDYILGGFVSRVLTLDAYANEVNMNVEAITYANVSMTWSVKSLPNKRTVGTTAVPDANSWCLHTLSTNPTIVRILDTSATLGSSIPTTITIQET